MADRTSAKYIASVARVARQFGLSVVCIGDIKLVLGPVQAIAPKPSRQDSEPNFTIAHDKDELDTEAIDNDPHFLSFSQRGVNPVGGS